MAEDNETTAQKIERELAAPPSWQANGGIRGEQSGSRSYSELPDGQVRREPRQPAFPAEPAETGGVGGSVIDLVGAYNAGAVTFHLLQDSPPTPLP